MPMKLGEFNQLKKLMMLTHSDNDAEALSALRKANEKLKAHGYDWNAVFGRLVKVQDEIESMETLDQKDEKTRIQEAFDFIKTKGYRSNFITSLAEQWEDRKWLSPAQKESLFKTENRLRGQ